MWNKWRKKKMKQKYPIACVQMELISDNIITVKKKTTR